MGVDGLAGIGLYGGLLVAEWELCVAGGVGLVSVEDLQWGDGSVEVELCGGVSLFPEVSWEIPALSPM